MAETITQKLYSDWS